MVGTALAANRGQFQWLPCLLCLSFALLIQISANFENDYFDFKKGTDNSMRKGPKRAVAQGWITPRAMMTGTLVTLSAAFLVGINLVSFGGYGLIMVGLLSIAFAILYTGGPYPLAYLGLGDLFVLIFFGWIAVMFTYYVQAGHHSWAAFHLGTVVGCLSVNLLLINNYRDYENDKESNKNTTVVKFGLVYGRWQYRVALSLAILSIGCIIASSTVSPLFLLSALTILPGFNIAYGLKIADSAEDFNKLLKQTSGVLFFYATIASILLISL
jgi:1,4-dihydroxy-2-naphthoate polyprenyltransferase